MPTATPRFVTATASPATPSSAARARPGLPVTASAPVTPRPPNSTATPTRVGREREETADRAVADVFGTDAVGPLVAIFRMTVPGRRRDRAATSYHAAVPRYGASAVSRAPLPPFLNLDLVNQRTRRSRRGLVLAAVTVIGLWTLVVGVRLLRAV